MTTIHTSRSRFLDRWYFLEVRATFARWVKESFWLPSRELTYPPDFRHIWRWFSFCPGGICIRSLEGIPSWKVTILWPLIYPDEKPSPPVTHRSKVKGIISKYEFFISNIHTLEDTPDVSPTVYEGFPFFVGFWGSLGYLPRVCGQNHWNIVVGISDVDVFH